MRLVLLAAMVAAAPASAAVTVTANGFVTEAKATVAAPPAAVWAALIDPARYWSPGHSYSGDAANFSLDAKAGGCFCESWAGGASIEHMRVVLVWPERTLRLTGGLGPLQSEGVAGTLTWELKPAGPGTEITQTYAVGGSMRFDMAETAPMVGAVLEEQLRRLSGLFGSD